MLELRPVSLARVSPGVPALLQEGHFVRFTDAWPDALDHVKGGSFQIDRVNQVPYDLSYIIPTGDYRDVDISNSDDGEKIYPANVKTLYEIALGFKPGNYLAHFYIPSGEYVNRLEYTGMVPDVSSSTRRYLGARKPADSPYDDKRIFIYSVYKLEPLIIRLYVEAGIEFEKCVLGLIVNKCYLKPVSLTAEQMARAKVIRYYTELRW